jgi:hypothetical protein
MAVYTRYIENKVGILVPPSRLDKNCAYRYVNNLLMMNMKQWALLPELKGRPVYGIRMDLTTVEGYYIQVQKDYDNNIYAAGIDDHNVTGASVSSIKVRYVIPVDTEEIFIIQDIIASEMLESNYRLSVDISFKNYRIIELEAAPGTS